MTVKVIAEVSARHVHLSEKDLELLFGKNYILQKKYDLSQPEQFAALEKLEIRGSKNISLHARVLGPTRAQTQVELSFSDCLLLGIEPVLRLSGDLASSSPVTLVGPQGSVELREGVIVAQRHLHLSETDAQQWQLKDQQEISVKTEGPRELIFHKIKVRIGNFQTRLHLDTDEANAAGLKNNDQVYLEI